VARPLLRNFVTFLEAASVIKFIFNLFISDIINIDADVSDLFENVMFLKHSAVSLLMLLLLFLW